jgi:hypothetical protein
MRKFISAKVNNFMVGIYLTIVLDDVALPVAIVPDSLKNQDCLYLKYQVYWLFQERQLEQFLVVKP